MDKIFKKLTIRTFITNFKQFLSVILIVFMSSMLFSGFITNYHMLNKAINTYFKKTNLADIWFYVDKVSEEDENFFKENEIKYDKRLYIETLAEISSGLASNNAKIYIYDGKISNPYMEKGKWGCIIDKNVYENNDLKIGSDKLTFSYSYNFKGQVYEFDLSFPITGTMSHTECADSISSWPIFITEDYFLSKINEKITKITNSNDCLDEIEIPYNQILIDTNNINETTKLIEEYYNESSSNIIYSFDKNSVESVVLLNSEVNQAKKMIFVFPVIFLVVSIFIILTTINQLVIQEKQRIGTLKSIGIPNKKIIHHYSKFGAILCAIGSALGIIFGSLLVPSIMFIKYNLVYSIPNDYIVFKVPFDLLFIVVITLTIMGYFVAYIACRKFLKKKPIHLLKFDTNNVKIKGKHKIKKLPFTLKMAIRNIRIKPIRTLMAIIGVAGCVSLILCGFGVGDTLRYSVKYDFGRNFHYDITTTYSTDDFEEKVKSLDGVITYEKFEKMYASAKSKTAIKNVNLYKLQPLSLLTNIYMKKGETLISESEAKDLGLKKGDKLLLTLGSVSKEVTITKIIKTSVMNGVYISEDYGFDNSLKSFGMWIEYENLTEDKIEYLNSINGTNTAFSMNQYIENMEEKISSIKIMTDTLKLFAISLVIVVFLNLIFLIFKERIREFATLKVLGNKSITILLTLFFEILIISFIGLIFGMIAGYPLLILVLSINKVESLNFLYNIKFASYLSSIFVIAITIFIVMLFCYKKVRKINMIESLKSVE